MASKTGTVTPGIDLDVSDEVSQQPPDKVGGDGAGPKDGEIVEEIPTEEDVTIRLAASIYPGMKTPLPDEFSSAIRELESELGMPVWLLIQSEQHGSEFNNLSSYLVAKFRQCRASLTQGKPIALVIDSPGGYAQCAYQLARFLQRRCGGFTVVVPRYAKSAATLLALGGDQIIMGSDAEIGPLDTQILDPDREDMLSALDELQALERLHAFALEALDSSMQTMLMRSGKKIQTLLPLMLEFTADFMRPMMEKIDAVHYTQMSRALKVSEEYAIRLMSSHYGDSKAEEIARHLVEDYPDHGFVIDAEEATKFGLEVKEPSSTLDDVFSKMLPFLSDGITVIGCLQETTDQ